MNAPRWRPTPIPHKHVNGRGRYMAAVCYTCYRPARTGYVRQSIALILALGAALCVPVVVCTAMQAVYRFNPLRPSCPLTHSRRDPLHRSSQELHHQVITSTSSHVYPHRGGGASPASHPGAFTVCDRFLNLCGLSPRIIAERGVPEKVGEIDVSTLRVTSHFDKPVRYFGFWPVVSLPASFVLHRRAISGEFRSLA